MLERALYLAPGDVLAADDLHIDEPTAVETHASSSTLRDVERAHIERVIALHGSVGEAARSLGISRSSLYLKVKELQILRGRGSARRIKTGNGA